jgi:hypothetical protein
MTTSIKPSHKAIRAYRDKPAEFQAQGVSHESAVTIVKGLPVK